MAPGLFGASKHISPLEGNSIPFPREGSARTAADRVLSISFIPALSDEAGREAVVRTEHFLANHPQTRGKEKLAIPYVTELYWSRLKG